MRLQTTDPICNSATSQTFVICNKKEQQQYMQIKIIKEWKETIACQAYLKNWFHDMYAFTHALLFHNGLLPLHHNEALASRVWVGKHDSLQIRASATRLVYWPTWMLLLFFISLAIISKFDSNLKNKFSHPFVVCMSYMGQFMILYCTWALFYSNEIFHFHKTLIKIDKSALCS